MERFVFNRNYFANEYPGRTQSEKINKIIDNSCGSETTWKSKFLRPKNSLAYRPINEDDYEVLKKVDKRFVLDTDRLIEKLFLRVNLDLTPNQKYVLYLMLCLQDEDSKLVSIDDLKRKVKDEKFKQKLTENILNHCEVPVDSNGTMKKLFVAKGEKFSIDLTTLILFTELD